MAPQFSVYHCSLSHYPFFHQANLSEFCCSLNSFEVCTLKDSSTLIHCPCQKVYEDFLTHWNLQTRVIEFWKWVALKSTNTCASLLYLVCYISDVHPESFLHLTLRFHNGVLIYTSQNCPLPLILFKFVCTLFDVAASVVRIGFVIILFYIVNYVHSINLACVLCCVWSKQTCDWWKLIL